MTTPIMKTNANNTCSAYPQVTQSKATSRVPGQTVQTQPPSNSTTREHIADQPLMFSPAYNFFNLQPAGYAMQHVCHGDDPSRL